MTNKKLRKFHHLNESGIGHHIIVPALVILIVAVVGV